MNADQICAHRIAEDARANLSEGHSERMTKEGRKIRVVCMLMCVRVTVRKGRKRGEMRNDEGRDAG